jgi:hypothetical protein
MVQGLISLLVVVLILCVLWYIVKLLAAHFGAPPVVVQITGLILALVVILAVLRLIGAVPAGWRGP